MVQTGKIADVVLLDANPLDDVSNTRKIRGVVLNSRYLDHHAVDKLPTPPHWRQRGGPRLRLP
jgi:hypothetical protein